VILASIRRAPIEVLHPKEAGPRYFFYPFIILGWIFVQIAAVERRALSIAAVVVLSISGRNAVETAQRRHTTIDWRADIATCLKTPPDQHCWFGGHFDGSDLRKYRVIVPRQDCERLIRASVFDNRLP
jgi:hypothetical protein